MDDLKSAISRKLSPLQKTASVAGMKSTYELGSEIPKEGVFEEMATRELAKRSMGQ